MAVIVAAHLSLAPAVASVDGFYHVGHAAQYATHGLFDTSFPWATQSVIADRGGDLWWGFHVLLVPFALLGSVATAMRVSALVFTSVLAGGVWWVLRRHAVPAPGWWTALFLVAVPNVLYRYLMVRPHVLSLALALVLLSLLVRGRRWQVLLAAAAITWLHLSLFWMAPGIVAAYVLARVVARPGSSGPGVPALPALFAVLAGTLLGALLRPHPLATAELAYVQIVRLFTEKATDQPLIFATELLPLPAGDLVRSAWSFLAAWIVTGVAAVAWARKSTRAVDADGDGALRKDDPSGGGGPNGGGLPDPERLLLLVTYLVSGVFLALTVLSARRALVEFTAFGFLALPLVWGLAAPRQRLRRAVPVLLVFLAGHLLWAGQRHLLNAGFVAFPADAMGEVGAFLETEAAPGDTVFHAHWDNFGPLFSRDRERRYIGGMDPIFQFAHDPGRYWEHFFLSGDLVQEYTCDAWPCYEGTATDTWEAIRRHFGARLVVVEPLRNPKFTLYLLRDPRFSLVFETQHEAVFRLLEPEDAPPAPDPAP
jgi:hypothetical protein